jgi:DNA polymerase III epsilon subunit-like protein
MNNRYIVLDVETTGLESENNSVIEIGAIAFDDNEDLDYPIEVSRFSGKMGSSQYRDVDVEALQINGRLASMDVMVDDFELEAVIWQGFADWLAKYANKGCYILGHNVQFDLNFLVDGALRHHLDLTKILNRTIVDTKQVAAFLKDSGVINPDNLRLITLWNYLFLEDPKTGNKENSHSAMQDAFMTSQLYFRMREAV